MFRADTRCGEASGADKSFRTRNPLTTPDEAASNYSDTTVDMRSYSHSNAPPINHPTQSVPNPGAFTNDHRL